MDLRATGLPTVVSLVLLALLGVWTSGCGGTGQSGHRIVPTSAGAMATAGAATASSEAPLDKDGDRDGTPNNEIDDTAVIYFGHPASSADARAVSALVAHYDAVVAANDGAAVCAMMAILRNRIVDDYGRSPGPASLRGNTCAVVMSKLLAQRHSFMANLRPLKVVGVRVRGDSGLALLGSGSAQPRHYVSLTREHGNWRINQLFDGEIL